MRWRLAEDVTLTDTESGAVLLDERTGRYWQTNGTGAIILRAVAHDAAVDDVIRAVRDGFPDATSDLGGDVRRFLEHLEHTELIRREP